VKMMKFWEEDVEGGENEWGKKKGKHPKQAAEDYETGTEIST
jgi:hypothetical protein